MRAKECTFQSHPLTNSLPFPTYRIANNDGVVVSAFARDELLFIQGALRHSSGEDFNRKPNDTHSDQSCAGAKRSFSRMRRISNIGVSYIREDRSQRAGHGSGVSFEAVENKGQDKHGMLQHITHFRGWLEISSKQGIILQIRGLQTA